MSETGVKRILLVVESSDAGIRAARAAVGLAAQIGATVYAAYVVDTGTLRQLLSGRILVAEEMAEFEEDLAGSGRTYLRMVEELGKEQGVTVEPQLLKGAWPQAMLGEAKRVQADLIVLGGFKFSMIKRDLAVRQKQGVIDDAPCPVMIVG